MDRPSGTMCRRIAIEGGLDDDQGVGNSQQVVKDARLDRAETGEEPLPAGLVPDELAAIVGDQKPGYCGLAGYPAGLEGDELPSGADHAADEIEGARGNVVRQVMEQAVREGAVEH